MSIYNVKPVYDISDFQAINQNAFWALVADDDSKTLKITGQGTKIVFIKTGNKGIMFDYSLITADNMTAEIYSKAFMPATQIKTLIEVTEGALETGKISILIDGEDPITDIDVTEEDDAETVAGIIKDAIDNYQGKQNYVAVTSTGPDEELEGDGGDDEEPLENFVEVTYDSATYSKPISITIDSGETGVEVNITQDNEYAELDETPAFNRCFGSDVTAKTFISTDDTGYALSDLEDDNTALSEIVLLNKQNAITSRYLPSNSVFLFAISSGEVSDKQVTLQFVWHEI